jgi:hypothetical protein
LKTDDTAAAVPGATIFLSYRRNDSIEQTNKLDEALAREFPGLGVFIDRRALAGGDDFERVIGQRLRETRLVLVLMGPGWAGPLAGGRQRIEEPRDVVRREVEQALQGLAEGRHVLPVLVGGAAMPAPESLPPTLQPLAGLNALPLRSGEDQRGDLLRILARVRAILDDPLAPPLRPFLPRSFDGEDERFAALQASFQATHQTLQALLATCSSQASALRHQAETLLASAPLWACEHPAWALMDFDHRSGLTHLDHAIDSPLLAAQGLGGGGAGAVGNLTGRGDLRLLRGPARQEVDMALRLGDAFNATARALQPVATVGWVYYISRQRFIHIHPWVHAKVVAWADRLLKLDFFTGGLPRANPARRVFWTTPYEDHYGKGMMVTVAAPVYRGRRFLGTVAIDLQTDLLNDFIASHQMARGPVFVVNAQGVLIAAPGIARSRDSQARQLADALPPALAGLGIEALAGRHATLLRGAHLLLTAPIADTGWTLVHVCERRHLG